MFIFCFFSLFLHKNHIPKQILYLVKLCAYENESILSLREKVPPEIALEKSKKFQLLLDEIQKRKKAAVLPKGELQKKSLAHLAASDEELYSLLKND